MRLPNLALSTVCCQLSLILWEFGISSGSHWIVPVLRLGLGKCYPLFFVLKKSKLDLS
jgi:hypothetical protein